MDPFYQASQLTFKLNFENKTSSAHATIASVTNNAPKEDFFDGGDRGAEIRDSEESGLVFESAEESGKAVGGVEWEEERYFAASGTFQVTISHVRTKERVELKHKKQIFVSYTDVTNNEKFE